MCIFTFSIFPLFFHLALSSHISLCLFFFISLFSSGSIFTCLPLSLFFHLALSSHVSLLLCVWVCGCVLVLWVWVCAFLLVLHFKRPPCVRSKRSRVYFPNAPVCTFKTPASHWKRTFSRYTRERFDRTYGSVLNVHTGALFLCVSLSSLMCLSSHTSLCHFSSFFLYLLSIPFKKIHWSLVQLALSLYTRPWLASSARVRGPWPIHCRASMFASCKKQSSCHWEWCGHVSVQERSMCLVRCGVCDLCLCALVWTDLWCSKLSLLSSLCGWLRHCCRRAKKKNHAHHWFKKTKKRYL